uniref:Transcription factor bHLH46 n=1 Tax=Nothapodytes nimmoniana TaxID=159386 RepID=A0A9E8Z0G5_NOTNI|nr:transcription factor bHLH46 [Nothapodytes nimmoniana]
MEKDSGFSFRHQYCDWESLDFNSISAQFDWGKQNTACTYMNPCSDKSPKNGTLRLFQTSGLPQTKAGHANEPHNWFYSLPPFHGEFTPSLNCISKEKIFSSLNDNFEGVKPPYEGSDSAQKRFVVFDQSGDQTTLIFSSAVGTAVPHSTPWSPNLPALYNLKRDDSETKRERIYPVEPFLPDDEESNRDDVNEMRENTEELNALLFSDDEDDYSEDGEETSTGHSPDTMTAYDKQDLYEEICEEVASSVGPTKRQKLASERCFLPPLVDTAHFVKQDRCFGYEDDAESICSNGSNQAMGKKRTREEEIHCIVNILQSIIPGGKGKDAITVLDEAVHYFEYLKLEAKALGLSL